MTPLHCALLAALAFGADTDAPKPGDKLIDDYLKRLTREQSEKFLDGAKTREEWEKKRPRLRREYLDMLGLWPLPEKTPLKPTITGTLEHEGVVIEKLHFQSLPGLYVTGNLYYPKEVKGPKPTILYVCGHSNRGRDGNKTAFQDHGLWFANNGYVCLIIDTLQLGEVAGKHHGTYNLGRWWWQAAGYTPAGVECWNGVRGIDYLVSRPDVDAAQIAVTGISGGGAATFWIAAADDRVRCAVPVSGMSDLESYVKNKIINGHCDCMFLYNTYQWDWTTIAALVAPRPLLFANSDNDPIFPMDANRRIIAKLRKIYKMYGKRELVDEYVSKGGHDYRPDLRIAIFKWINQHTKNDTTTPVEDTRFADLPGMLLRVFRDDADVPKDAINAKIDETFVPRAKVELPEKGTFAEWKKVLIKELRERFFLFSPGPIRAAKKEGLELGLTRLETEPGIITFATPVWRKGQMKKLEAILVEGDESKDIPDKTSKIINKWFFSSSISGLYGIPIRGSYLTHLFPEGKSWEWTRKSPPNFVERSHALLGRTVDQTRVRDIIASAKWMKTEEKINDLILMGYGQAGILAAYAALFEPSIKEVVIIDPPKSHKEGPYFLGVLRVLDIPEALGLLAPNVKLTLINARDPAFDRTEQIYKLAGAADKLVRK